MVNKPWIKDNYSTYQMDNFYYMLSKGIVKSSGIMNYIQHIYIAKKCFEGSSILDMCCGRGLMIPILKYNSEKISKYIGIDISKSNLKEAKKFLSEQAISYDIVPYDFIEGDVTKLTDYFKVNFDIIVYTSAIEHLKKDDAIKSLKEAYDVLKQDGTLYLSTPRTKSNEKLQYKVHIYEWDKEELEDVLDKLGFNIIECIGLLPPSDEVLYDAIKTKFSNEALNWFKEMKKCVPKMFLDSVVSTCLTEVAKELLFVCKKR